jgi:hypothetical protein
MTKELHDKFEYFTKELILEIAEKCHAFGNENSARTIEVMMNFSMNLMVKCVCAMSTSSKKPYFQILTNAMDVIEKTVERDLTHE